MNLNNLTSFWILTVYMWISCVSLSAQFIDDFENDLVSGQNINNGWDCRTGDGNAEIKFIKDGRSWAEIEIDATKDKNNIWWAIIYRKISDDIDIKKLLNDEYELRVEAKVKPSHGPRRINLHLNTQRTTDFHTHLMEYDLNDTSSWHKISMTTSDFDVKDGDEITVQLALMDWGLRKYSLLIDYIKVDVVPKDSIKFDLGNPQMYHPPIPKLSSFTNNLMPQQDGVISHQYQDQNYSSLAIITEDQSESVLMIDCKKFSVLRWDFSGFADNTIDGTSVLKLSTKSLIKLSDNIKDFGLIRVCEIIGGKTGWKRNDLTLNSLKGDHQIEPIINGQMIIDVEVNPELDGSTFITIPESVMNRLFSGSTTGIALQPLGEINAAFHSTFTEEDSLKPQLYFNLKE